MLGLRKGERVVNPVKPEWGVGLVLNNEFKGRVYVYFIWAGKKLLFTTYVKLEIARGWKRISPVLDLIERELLDEGDLIEGHHNIYVIELDKNVLQNRKFREANPQHISSKPCVYVGMTGLTPEERFTSHRSGYKSSYYPHKYGQKLLYEFFQSLNPMPYKLACLMESELANHLRCKGFGVWQN